MPARKSSPPVDQAYHLKVGCAEFLSRQPALPMAAARAVAALPADIFEGLQLLLVSNPADEAGDGWLRLTGHGDGETVVFLELVATRTRRWFRTPVFRVALTAYLPPGALGDVIGLITLGAGAGEWEKERGGRDEGVVFACEIGRPVISQISLGM